MNGRTFLLAPLLVAALTVPGLLAQDEAAIDTEALIEQFLSVDSRQREQIRDVVFDTEMLEGKMDGNDSFEQQARFIKRVSIKFLQDTALFHEEYLEYYKDGKLESPKECEKQAKERLEKKRKRNARDISFPMLQPFQPDHRTEYDISYVGIAEEIEGRNCYHFKVRSLVEDDEHINGDYYFDIESFQVVRVDFAPAKLIKKAMFKLKQLDMTIVYGPTTEGYWLPVEFDIAGKGKAAFLFGVNFAGIEYYRNPQINVGLPDSLFEESDGKE